MIFNSVLKFINRLRGKGMSISVTPRTTDELHALHGHDDDVIRETEPLSDADYALIGRFIQAYCWADLNARRVINLLRVINRGDRTEFATRLNEKATIEHLKSEAEDLAVLPNVKEGLLRVAEILVMHHDQRHEFAHWAARRSRVADGFIALTKYGREAARRGVDISGGGDNIAFCFLPVKEIEVECEKLYGHGHYLATTTVFLAEHIARQGGESDNTLV